MIHVEDIAGTSFRFDIDAGGDRADIKNEGQGYSTFVFALEDIARIVPEGFSQIQTSERDERRYDLLSSLLDSYEDDEGLDIDDCEVHVSDIDAAIVFLALAADRGMSLDVGWQSEGSAFWLLHDIEHIRHDTYVDDDSVGINFLDGTAESAATVRAAISAIRSGTVPASEVLAELVDNARPFQDRFGYESSALDDFLSRVDVTVRGE